MIEHLPPLVPRPPLPYPDESGRAGIGPLIFVACAILGSAIGLVLRMRFLVDCAAHLGWTRCLWQF
jgi:hypothetical protein